MPDDELVCAHSANLLDKAIMQKFNLSVNELVARAGQSAFKKISEMYSDKKKLDIFCGPGKNGVDGLHIAKRAVEKNWSVKVYLSRLNFSKNDLQISMQRELFRLGVSILTLNEFEPSDSIVVDAIFGVGLNKPLPSGLKSVINKINKTSKIIVAIDVPAGVDATTGRVEDVAINADITISFLAGKQGTFTGEGKSHAGKVFVDKLSLDIQPELKKFRSSRLQRFHSVRNLVPSRSEYSNKLDYGHCMIIGGAPGFTGAALIASQAALRSGSGLVSLATHFSNSEALISCQPEIMLHKIENPNDLAYLITRMSAVGIGPGLGLSKWGREMYKTTLDFDGPVVFDADALNLLAEKPNRNDMRILTPHVREAGRLLGISEREVEFDRFFSAAKLVEIYGGVCLLKGPGTIIAGTGRTPRIIAGGHSGMATGGMGDLLTGIILSFLGQGVNIFDAAVLGACIHNHAADQAKHYGSRGMLPTDLLPIIRNIIQ